MNIGNVTITAPANGTVHLLLTGYAAMTNNNSVRLGIGSSPRIYDLDQTVAGIIYGTGWSLQSIDSQAVVSVIQGNKYTFFASTDKYSFDDDLQISLNYVKLTAVFYAT